MGESAHMRNCYIVVLLIIRCHLIRGEFRCLCSYSLKLAVFQARATTAETNGFLNEFDCKPIYEPLADDRSWMAIQIEHKVGYVLMTPDQVIQQCLGRFDSDQVTETSSAATSTTTKIPTQSPTSQQPSIPQATTQPLTTQPPPTQPLTTHPYSSEPPTTQSIKTQPPTHRSITTSAMTTHTHTTQPITTPTSSHSKPATQSPTTQTLITQPTIHQMTTQPPPSTTTQSTTTTTSLKTTKQYTIQTTKPTPHPTLTTIHTIPPLTTTKRANTHMPSMTNATANSCPDAVVNHASSHHNQGYVMSRGDSCFELNNHTQNWTVAEHSCQQRGGHLTSIKNLDEENALLAFMYNHGVKQEVWIGLNDRHQEHHFTWSSGLPLTWTNWIPGKQNNVWNNHDDCVAIFPDDSMVGTWDDAHCGTTKPFICRFDAHPASHLIG